MLRATHAELGKHGGFRIFIWLLCMMLHKVGKTDAANQSLFMQSLHGFPCLYIQAAGTQTKLQLVGWPMNEVKVEIIKQQIAQCLVKRLQCLIANSFFMTVQSYSFFQQKKFSMFAIPSCIFAALM